MRVEARRDPHRPPTRLVWGVRPHTRESAARANTRVNTRESAARANTRANQHARTTSALESPRALHEPEQCPPVDRVSAGGDSELAVDAARM